MQIEIKAPLSTCKVSRLEEVLGRLFVLHVKNNLPITMCGLRFLPHVGSSRPPSVPRKFDPYND